MSDSGSDELSFEQALEALETIVRKLEDGQIGLEESLQRYEMGVRLLKRCYGQLSAAEQRITQLTGVDEEGRPLLQVFQHAPSAEVEKADGKRRRKKGDDPENRFS